MFTLPQAAGHLWLSEEVSHGGETSHMSAQQEALQSEARSEARSDPGSAACVLSVKRLLWPDLVKVSTGCTDLDCMTV